MKCDLGVMQVVDGANEGSVGSPGFSDDDSIRDLGSEHGESMAELQRQVQKWQDESWELCQSLEAKEIELDEALEREEGLKSSLTSLQHHLHLHDHLITVPTSPLVSLSFPAPLYRPLVAAKQCPNQAALACAYHMHTVCHT